MEKEAAYVAFARQVARLVNQKCTAGKAVLSVSVVVEGFAPEDGRAILGQAARCFTDEARNDDNKNNSSSSYYDVTLYFVRDAANRGGARAFLMDASGNISKHIYMLQDDGQTRSEANLASNLIDWL
jgi:hypothetical protein